MSSSIFRRFSSSARLGDLLVQAGILTPAQLQEAMRSSRSKKLQIGQVLVMSGYMTSRDLQLVLEAQSMLRDRTIDLNLAIQCIKVARKIGGNFSDVLEDYDATAAQRARTGKLGELLLEAGLVGEEDLSEAMERSVNTGMPLGRMLVLNRILPSEVLQKALEVQVRLRDEVVTREEAILELRQAAGLEGEAPKAVVEDKHKKKPVVRLGELLVMAGILNENDVMDALEWGLANQQPIGIVLVSQELITKELLDAALFFQNAVRDGKMDAMKACELLSEVFSTGCTPEEALADATPSRTRQEPEVPPITYQQLITMSRVVTDEEIENAFNLEKQNAALIGKVLVLTGLMDVPTLQNTLRCYQMVAKGWLTPDDAIASLDYCLHQNADMPMAFEQALRELKWNPDTGLKMRGEPGATESSTDIPVLTESSTKTPAVAAEPAEKVAADEDKKRPAAPADEDEVSESDATSEIKAEETKSEDVNGKEDLEKTVDQPIHKPEPEKVAVAGVKEEAALKSSEPATGSNKAEPTSSRSVRAPAIGDDDDDEDYSGTPSWEDPTSLLSPSDDEESNETKAVEPEAKKDDAPAAEKVAEPTVEKVSEPEPASELSNGKPENKTEKADAEVTQEPIEAAVREPEKQVAKVSETKSAEKTQSSSGGGGGDSAPSLANALKSLYDDSDDDDVEPEPVKAPEVAKKDEDENSAGGLKKLLSNLIAASGDGEDEEEEAPEVAAEAPKPVEEPAAEEPAAEEPAAKAPAAEEPAAEPVVEEKPVEEKPAAIEEPEPATPEPEPVKAEAEAIDAKTTSDEIVKDSRIALDQSLEAAVAAAKASVEAKELAAVEDVAAMSAEQLLVEIMKSAQNPDLKPATKRGGRFSETILPEDAKARQLAKLVGKEASKDLADKLAFDQGDENTEAVDTAFGRLAETYFEQGNYKEAQVIYERMLVHRLNELGPDNPLLVEDYNNLAMTLCVQGRFDKAEPFMKRAVHLYESAPKQDPVEHADYLHSLGTILYKLEKHKDAEEIMLRVVSIRRESLEVDHEDIGRALADYAKVLKKLGKDESAEAIYKKAREILKKHKD